MGRDVAINLYAVDGPISIHSPRMGRDHWIRAWLPLDYSISIHSPRMGRDRKTEEQRERKHMISIHSPRMGRDVGGAAHPPQFLHFNPLSPHGERPSSKMIVLTIVPFQSTLPAWGETGLICPMLWVGQISIHSPRMGRDLPAVGNGVPRKHFNPLSPHGERQRIRPCARQA